ncbi:MAG: GntR family transcriptional regulator [Lachnospiraceae bacterium]|nr:GntR family transcriptional regulator [Lachnospiraceae bacterium]MDY5578278.1 GntR family transcriptional regulator [Lachnospiraceae bacterium]
MEIILNYQSKVSIYEQIALQIKTQILDGTLKEGESLPPMRTFAKSLGVSVITTQKAYELLQSEGFITSMIGKGTFVAIPELTALKAVKQQEIERQMKNLIESAYSNGYEMEELVQMFEEKCHLFKMLDKE